MKQWQSLAIDMYPSGPVRWQAGQNRACLLCGFHPGVAIEVKTYPRTQKAAFAMAGHLNRLNKGVDMDKNEKVKEKERMRTRPRI